MQLLIKVAIFVVFVLAYLAICVVYALVDRRRKLTEPARSDWDWFLNFQFLTFWPYLLLLIPIFVLAGELPWALGLLFVGAGEVSLLVNALAMGMAQNNRQMLTRWQMLRWLAQRPELALAELGLVILSLLAFPVAAGVIYFGHQRPSASMTLLIFQATLVLLYFSGVPLVVIGAVTTLSSPFIDESTRVRVLIGQSAALVPTAIAAAVALWAFKGAGPGTTLTAGGASIALSPQLALFTAAYFVLVLIVPYAIGSQRAKAKRLEFLDQRKDYLNSTQEALALPDSVRRVATLKDLSKNVGDTIGSLSNGDPSPQFLAENQEPSASDQKAISRVVPSPLALARKPETDAFYAGAGKLVAAAYLASQEDDSRLQHLAWLRKFGDDLSSALEQVEKGGRQLPSVAREWKDSFATRLNTVKDEIDEAGKARTPVSFVAVSFLGPLFSSVFVTGLGGWLWSTFERTLLR